MSFFACYSRVMFYDTTREDQRIFLFGVLNQLVHQPFFQKKSRPNGQLVRRLSTLGPFSRKARKLFGQEGKCWILAQFIGQKPVNFALLTDNFIVSCSKLLKLRSWMQTRRTQNSFPGPKRYMECRETGPWTRHRSLKYPFNYSDSCILYLQSIYYCKLYEFRN